jgi:hypothetical protein
MFFTLALSSTLIAPAPGFVLSLADRVGRCAPIYTVRNSPSEPPQNISVSTDGSTIAYVEHVAPPRCGYDRIVVLRSSVREILRSPLPEMCAGCSNPGEMYDIARLRVFNDQTILATVDLHFSGAYSGIKRTTFFWDRSVWSRLKSYVSARRRFPDNQSLADGASRRRFAVNFDWDDDFSAFQAFVSKESGDAPIAAIVDHDVVHWLGRGTVTSVACNAAVGYEDEYAHHGTIRAIRWTGGKRADLGAGVAFDCDGDFTVGDDRSRWFDSGQPVMWNRGVKTKLLNELGSAFGIRGDIVVGSANHKGFILRSDERHHFVNVPTNLKLSSIFAITTGGRMLALQDRGTLPTALLSIGPIAMK